jgi:methionyl-tRNA formyltransferase
MRILFAGSPGIALPALERAAAEHEVVGVLTNPEAAAGRGLSAARTPVAEAASRLGLPVLAFGRLGPESRDAVEPLGAELLVSFAYGRVFGPRFLALFPRGGLNIHPSILPRWRGAAPIPYAILNRDSETGVSVQAIAPELDSGDLYAVERIRLDGTETTESLSARAAAIGADLLSRVLADIAAGRASPQPQTGEPSWCGIVAKEEGAIDWNRSAMEIDARVRAMYPWPLAYTRLRGARLNVLEVRPFPDEPPQGLPPGTVVGLDKARGIMVQSGNGLIALRRLQMQTKKALPYREFANGVRDLAGVVLGDVEDAALGPSAGQEPGSKR